MNGILVIDKPSGPTSHDICQYFKRTLPVKKVGHAGTLDPLATGVLVILLDQATKLQPLFLKQDKEYEFTIELGVATDTYDSEGKVVSQSRISPLAGGELKTILPQFVGEILQVPPPFSAIKKNGRPLYQLARQGKTIDIPPRKIKIYSLDILKMNLPFVTLRARCSSGTYIRSLAHDIGKELGVGAHITRLRRLRSEPFGLKDAITIY